MARTINKGQHSKSFLAKHSKGFELIGIETLETQEICRSRNTQSLDPPSDLIKFEQIGSSINVTTIKSEKRERNLARPTSSSWEELKVPKRKKNGRREEIRVSESEIDQVLSPGFFVSPKFNKIIKYTVWAYI